jgi:hypothetical protein
MSLTHHSQNSQAFLQDPDALFFISKIVLVLDPEDLNTLQLVSSGLLSLNQHLLYRD